MVTARVVRIFQTLDIDFNSFLVLSKHRIRYTMFSDPLQEVHKEPKSNEFMYFCGLLFDGSV